MLTYNIVLIFQHGPTEGNLVQQDISYLEITEDYWSVREITGLTCLSPARERRRVFSASGDSSLPSVRSDTSSSIDTACSII